jgi:class 3 adenylate cyclase
VAAADRTQAGWDNRISLLPRCRQPGDRPGRVAALAGRGYMVAGGLPEPRPDHLQAVARVELVMLDEVAAIAKETGKDGLPVRIGIDSGPVVAGVIGRRKFIYDL